jgi:hypothetical protein
MHRYSDWFATATSFVLGCSAAIVLQTMYGWWLNSGTGVVRTTLVLFTLGFLVALWRSGSPRARLVALWLGTFLGMTGVLFRTGPGNIWPIVLAVAATMTAGAVLAGSWIAGRIRTRS